MTVEGEMADYPKDWVRLLKQDDTVWLVEQGLLGVVVIPWRPLSMIELPSGETLGELRVRCEERLLTLCVTAFGSSLEGQVICPTWKSSPTLWFASAEQERELGEQPVSYQLRIFRQMIEAQRQQIGFLEHQIKQLQERLAAKRAPVSVVSGRGYGKRKIRRPGGG